MTDPQQDPEGNGATPDIGFMLSDSTKAASPEAQLSGSTGTEEAQPRQRADANPAEAIPRPGAAATPVGTEGPRPRPRTSRSTLRRPHSTRNRARSHQSSRSRTRQPSSYSASTGTRRSWPRGLAAAGGPLAALFDDPTDDIDGALYTEGFEQRFHQRQNTISTDLAVR